MDVGTKKLPELMEVAAGLQRCLGRLNSLKPDKELEVAVAGTSDALNTIILIVLRDGMRDVVLKMDPSRPQNWWHDLAVLQVWLGGVCVGIPTPILERSDWNLARVARWNVEKKKGSFGYIYSTRVCMTKDLGPAGTQSGMCYCGHGLSQHRRVRSYYEDKAECGTLGYPSLMSNTGYRETVPCSECECTTFTQVGT